MRLFVSMKAATLLVWISPMNDFQGYLGALFAILLFTSFVKLFTSLSILRYGLGLQGGGFGFIIGAIALALSMVVMNSQPGGIKPFQLLLGNEKNGSERNVENYEKIYRPFLEKHSDPTLRESILGIVNKNAPTAALVTAAQEVPFPVVAASFVLTEVREAFKIGLLFLIPFVLIDLLVTNLCMALNITQISASVLSLPLKLLLFLAVDGWGLLTQKLLGTYTI